jgi:6-phosphogluconolactonase (cycloisomerase 2 family)
MVPKPFETASSSSNQVVRYTKQFDVSNLENCCDLFVVSTYTDFDRLAHGPRGTESKNPIYVYRFNPSDGSMVLVNVTGDKRELVNPAFSRFHPRLNVVYSCTEDVENNGVIFAYAIDSEGGLTKLGRNVDAGGTSTCYLTFDKAQRHMLTVNYWDSTLAVIPTCSDTGELIGPINSMYDPKHGNKIVSAHKKCNHSKNDEFTINERQKDPHSHALVLDPFYGCVAYVPDLGKDVILL